MQLTIKGCLIKLFIIGILLIGVQVVIKIVFNWSYSSHQTTTTIINNGVTTTIDDKDPTSDVTTTDCSKKPFHTTSFPISSIIEDDFCIKFTDYKVLDNILEIDFDITNNGLDREIAFGEIYLGDDLGERYDGHVQLVTYVADFKRDFNNKKYANSQEDAMSMHNGVTIKGKIYVSKIPKEANKIVAFKFCWKHNKLNGKPPYCENKKAFLLPERTFSN